MIVKETETTAKHKRQGYGPIAAVLVTVGVYFASQIFVGLVVSLLPIVNGWSLEKLQDWLDTSAAAQFVMILAVEAITLWLIWLFLRLRRVKLKTIGLVKPEYGDVAYGLAGYAVYFVLFVMISVVARLLLPGLDMEQEQEIGFSKDITGLALAYVFASLVLLPPITEEIVTRGFLYTGLRKKLSVVTSAIVTSILFAAAHLQWGSGNGLLWVAALDTFVLSLILVYLREKTGSLWAPITVHMLKNGLAFTLLFIFKVS